MQPKPLLFSFLAILCFGMGCRACTKRFSSSTKDPLLALVEKRSFSVDVQSVGELEATRSHVISSSVRGDAGKIIYLIKDGTNVQREDVLLRMDTTPFEERIDDLKAKIQQQETIIAANEKNVEQERNNAEHEQKMAAFDCEQVEMEYNKMVYGDGPMEISRLKTALLKAKTQYEELEGYLADLLLLEEEGYINSNEKKQAERKLEEQKENYDSAQEQYDGFVQYVHPMQVKKAEAALQRTALKKEEVHTSSAYKIGTAYAYLESARQELEDLRHQLRFAEWELSLTEVKAPTDGMVVLREEYRSGQRRKPLVGDVLIKNQPILDLPDLRSMTVKTKVREVDLYKIGLNKPVTVEVDAYPGLIFSGRVQWVGVLAQADHGRAGDEKFFEVKVLLDEPDTCLRPGMTARVAIHADAVDDAISIPVHAVFYKNKQPFCYVSRRGKSDVRPINMGTSNEYWVEIQEGLAVGERVYITPPLEGGRARGRV